MSRVNVKWANDESKSFVIMDNNVTWQGLSTEEARDLHRQLSELLGPEWTWPTCSCGKCEHCRVAKEAGIYP